MAFEVPAFRAPRLRDGVSLTPSATGAEIVYRAQGCDIDFPEGHEVEARRLLERLAGGGAALDALKAGHPAFAGAIDDIVEGLDRLGLLTETQFEAPEPAVTGPQALREAMRFARRLLPQVARSAFHTAMVEQRVTERQLIGYALEYLHIVRLAPGLLGPALSLADSRRSRELLQDFLADELHHDRMIEAALSAAGIDPAGLTLLQPLPATFGLCATLGTLATHHPLSFKAALWLFEVPYPEFDEAFAASCRRVGLPEAFAAPILRHSAVNEDGEHDDISRALFADVAAVSRGDLVEMKKNLGAIVELMALQDREVLAYYGDADSRVPRVFD